MLQDGVDYASKYFGDSTFASSMLEASITCYTFGTPRVGNKRFKQVGMESMMGILLVVPRHFIPDRLIFQGV